MLLLPGRFDAALAAWLALGRQWLKKLSGATEEDTISMALLARKVTSPLGMAGIVPVRCRGGSAEPLLRLGRDFRVDGDLAERLMLVAGIANVSLTARRGGDHLRLVA